MNAKDLILENNEKRKLLNESNLKYYEDMIIYIRLNINKSEQRVEELLMELLDHLLEAQVEGRSAEQVFGENPKTYCNNLLREIPREENKLSFLFLTYLASQFLGQTGLIVGIVMLFMDHDKTISLGGSLLLLIDIILFLALSIFIILAFLRWSNDKNHSKIVDFFLLSILLTGCLVPSFLITSWIPSFGPEIKASASLFLVIGTLFVILSFLLNRQYKIVKN